MLDAIPEGCVPLTEVRQLYFDHLWRGGAPVEELRKRVRASTILPQVARDHLERLSCLEELEWQGLFRPFIDGRLETLVRLPNQTANFTVPRTAWADVFYPERLFLVGSIAPGHGEYWDSYIGRAPFVRRSQVTNWLSSTDATIVRLMGPRQQLFELARQIMLGLAQDGLSTPEELEDMAQRWGIRPFEDTPDSMRFNPLEKAVWTLPMVLAWLVWRNPDAVLGQWDDYRSECWNWHGFSRRLPVDGGATWREVHGYELVVRQMATARDLGLSEALEKAAGETEGCMSVKSAREVLWHVLASSALEANAVDRNGNVVTIPAREWIYLDLAHSSQGADYLTVKGQLQGAQYTDLTFPGLTVMRIWPQRQVSEKSFASGQIFNFPETERHWSLFEAAVWVGTEGEMLATDEIEERGLDEIGAKHLFGALNAQMVVATGINPSLLREPIPPEYWELATLDPVTEGHYVSFVDDAAQGFWGTMTPAGYSGPRWSRINIEASALKRAFPFSKSKPASCRKWLESEMRDSPTKRPRTKAEYLLISQERYAVKQSEFERAWKLAMESVPVAKPYWTKGGRPKKDGHSRSDS